MKNFEIARLFHEMASPLEVKNESVFRVRAYQRAAQTLATLTEDVAAVAARGALQRPPPDIDLGDLDFLELEIGVARRAWMRPDQVLDTRPLSGLLAWAGGAREAAG